MSSISLKNETDDSVVVGADTIEIYPVGGVLRGKDSDDVIRYMVGEGEVDDDFIGDRTVNQNVSMSNNTDTLTNILSALAGMVKKISGKTNWYTTPAITLETLTQAIQSTQTGQLTYLDEVNVLSPSSSSGTVTFDYSGLFASAPKVSTQIVGSDAPSIIVTRVVTPGTNTATIRWSDTSGLTPGAFKILCRAEGSKA